LKIDNWNWCLGGYPSSYERRSKTDHIDKTEAVYHKTKMRVKEIHEALNGPPALPLADLGGIKCEIEFSG
jgi:hypothetical protein